MEMERRAAGRVEVRAAGGDGAGMRIMGTPAVPYGALSDDLGGWREVIVPGAFDVVGQDIRSLWQHDATMVLGRTAAETMLLTDAEDGVYAEIEPPDTSWARDALVSIKRGDVSGFSFGFFVDEEQWVVTEREMVRRVLRGRLVEISPVTFPAYPQTSAELRDRVAAMRAQAVTVGNGQAARARRAARQRMLNVMEMVR